MHKHVINVLIAIILLNIIAITLLSNRVDEPLAVPEPQQQQQQPRAHEVQQEPVVPEEPLPLVRTVLLKPDNCPDCYTIEQYIDVLRSFVNMQVEEADPLYFKPSRLPALAFNNSIEAYPNMIENWETTGDILRIPLGEYKGVWYILPTLNAPYVAADNTIKGRVHVTYLTHDDCKECYDVQVTEIFMNDSRITPHSEETVDISSPLGQALVARYNITAVPTVIMDKEVDAYPNIRPGWHLVGTIEEDGSYVLRNLQKLRVTYYDLLQEQVMTP